MTKFERVVVVTGAGVIVLAWLFGRRGRAILSALNPFDAGMGNTSRGLPPRTQLSQPINNAFSTCDCPSARTTQTNPGDYSQGGFVRSSSGVVVPPTPYAAAATVPPSFGG